MKALYIPGADRSSRWFLDDYPGQAYFTEIEKTLVHSTETSKRWGCPGYGGGSNAPTITINPWEGFRRVWQHFPLNRAARALGNPDITPVSENKDDVFQVEIIGYSDPALGKAAGCYLPDLDDGGLNYIADTLAFVHREWSIPTTLPSTWPLYKVSSWDDMRAAHMTSERYDLHRGILAHLHAPKPSTHGDVALNIRLLKSKIDARIAPTVPPLVPYPGHQHWIDGRDDHHVEQIQKRLKQLGFYTGPIDEKFGPATRSAVIAFQRSKRLTADGYVGPATWRALGIRSW